MNSEKKTTYMVLKVLSTALHHGSSAAVDVIPANVCFWTTTRHTSHATATVYGHGDTTSF